LSQERQQRIKRSMTDPDLNARKTRASAWFKSLQEDICARFEALEDAAAPPLYKGPAGRFELTDWSRGDGTEDLGGGRMGLMRGRVFEKVGVHFSLVHGTFSEAFAAQIPGADRRECCPRSEWPCRSRSRIPRRP
jgi:coproporphyrinogen III oxidase